MGTGVRKRVYPTRRKPKVFVPPLPPGGSKFRAVFPTGKCVAATGYRATRKFLIRWHRGEMFLRYFRTGPKEGRVELGCRARHMDFRAGFRAETRKWTPWAFEDFYVSKGHGIHWIFTTQKVPITKFQPWLMRLFRTYVMIEVGSFGRRTR